MTDMARLLAFFPAVNRPVQDKTGLASGFEMDLTFTALPEQLGIRLEEQGGSVAFLFSNVERTSGN